MLALRDRPAFLGYQSELSICFQLVRDRNSKSDGIYTCMIASTDTMAFQTRLACPFGAIALEHHTWAADCKPGPLLRSARFTIKCDELCDKSIRRRT